MLHITCGATGSFYLYGLALARRLRNRRDTLYLQNDWKKKKNMYNKTKEVCIWHTEAK